MNIQELKKLINEEIYKTRKQKKLSEGMYGTSAGRPSSIDKQKRETFQKLVDIAKEVHSHPEYNDLDSDMQKFINKVLELEGSQSMDDVGAELSSFRNLRADPKTDVGQNLISAMQLKMKLNPPEERTQIDIPQELTQSDVSLTPENIRLLDSLLSNPKIVEYIKSKIL